MSQENVELYRRNAAAWSRGDRDGYLQDVNEDWEFHTSGVFPGLDPVYRGRRGALRLWEAMRGPWVEFSIRIDRVEDLGETLLALITFRAKGRDGIETTRPWAHVITYRNGVPRRTDNYASWKDALEAVGLRE